MKTRYSSLLGAALLLLVLPSCERETKIVTTTTTASTTTDDTPSWAAVEKVLKAHVSAMNREDLPTFMSYLHPAHEGFISTQAAARDLFSQYELSTTLESAEPVTLTEGEAKIKFVQLTKKVNGPEFRDNRVTGIHTLRKDNGLWKIFSTETSGVVYLDQPQG